MCAIVGFCGYVPEGQWGQTHEILSELLIAGEHRGRDATGFAAAAQPLGSKHPRVIVAKEPVPALDFVLDNPDFRRLSRRRCIAFLGHNRAATHGASRNNRNNHPHVGHVGLYLVHNGIIPDYREIADKYALRQRSECDSEVLLRLVEVSDHPAAGLEACLRETRGSMAVALYDERDNIIWLARNGGRPLWLARLARDRRWFFGSTPQILLNAFRRVLGAGVHARLDYLAPVPEDIPLSLSPDGIILAPMATVGGNPLASRMERP